MTVDKDKVVTIDYTLTGPSGEVLDTSKGRGPMPYLHGAGNIIPGLEKALHGKAEGDQLIVDVPPEEAYGARDPQMVQAVPRDRFQGVKDIAAGMQFQAQTPAGPRTITVVGVDDQNVQVDANHPLAGVPLKFDVKVVGVRDASAEELSHGHVHGVGGHEH